MTGPVMKMFAAAVLPLLLTTASAGRTDSVFGCTPKKLARDLVIYCRQPVNAPMPIDACCSVAVGTVGRPSCYCLVKMEQAFGMSPLLNISNMAHLLRRCGALLHLNQSLYNPCDRSDDEKETTEPAAPQMTPKAGTCKITKVSAYVAWGLVAILARVVSWLIFWRPEPATQVVYVPQFPLGRPSRNQNGDQGLRSSGASAAGIDSDSSDARAGEGSEDDLSDSSEKLIIEGKRNRSANPRFLGGSWVNTPLGPKK